MCCSKNCSSFSTSKELKSSSVGTASWPGKRCRKASLSLLTSSSLPPFPLLSPPLPPLPPTAPSPSESSSPDLLLATALWNLCRMISSPLNTTRQARGEENSVHFISSLWLGRYATVTSCICWGWRTNSAGLTLARLTGRGEVPSLSVRG